jgi:hypothetical protein
MAMITSLYWHSTPPANPTAGDCFVGANSEGMIWDGKTWVPFSGIPVPIPPFIPPTEEQLEKYPPLKEAWEEFLIIKKLLGV